MPPPLPTHLGSSSSTSLGYNDECPHVREVSSDELLLEFKCLVYVHFRIQKIEYKLASVEKEHRRVKKDNAALAQKKVEEEARRKEEARKKAEEDAQRKEMVVALTSDEDQSFKDVQT
jgi:hypothetical protein